jgi:hypothetical protein
MSKKRPHVVVVVIKRKPREIAEHAPGYAANGESQFSRGAARRGYARSISDLQDLLRGARTAASFDHDRQVRREAGARAKRIENELRRVGALPPSRGFAGRREYVRRS